MMEQMVTFGGAIGIMALAMVEIGEIIGTMVEMSGRIGQW